MKYVALLSVFTYWMPLIYIFNKWEIDSFKTISDHVSAGVQRKIHFFSSVLSILLLAIYIQLYIFVNYNIGLVGTVLLILAFVAHLSTIVVPRLDKKVDLHDRIAVVLGVSLFLILLLIAKSHNLTSMPKYFVLSAVVLMPFLGLSLLNRDRSHYTYYQIMYFSVFHIAMLVLAFLK